MEATINTDPIVEARRYVANAEEIIQKKSVTPVSNMPTPSSTTVPR